MRFKEFADPKGITPLPPKRRSCSNSFFICAPAGRPTTAHDPCRTTKSGRRPSEGNFSTRYERVSKAIVLGEISAALIGVLTIVQGSNRLRNSIPSSFLLTMHRTISDACAQSSSDGSFCVTIVSNARPELGIVRPIGNVRFALSSAVPTSAAISSRDCRIIDLCSSRS